MGNTVLLLSTPPCVCVALCWVGNKSQWLQALTFCKSPYRTTHKLFLTLVSEARDSDQG